MNEENLNIEQSQSEKNPSDINNEESLLVTIIISIVDEEIQNNLKEKNYAR